MKPQIFLTRQLPAPVSARLEACFALAGEIAGSAGVVTIPADVVGPELFDAAGPDLRIVARHVLIVVRGNASVAGGEVHFPLLFPAIT